jgi:peptidoglycan/LPS O-acetylase OafA/YrhL
VFATLEAPPHATSPVGRKPGRIAARLSRVTTTGRYIPEIDGLRFVAIASVFLFHLATNQVLRGSQDNIGQHAAVLARILGVGNVGVQAFFVISGFVLAIPFARHVLCAERRVLLRSYYLRRLTRLEPPYFLAMTLCYLLLVLTRGPSRAGLWPHLLVGFGYLNNVTFASDNPIDAVAWSLEVEVEFYVLVPLLAMVFLVRGTRLRRTILAAATLLSATVGPMAAAQSPHLRDTILNYGQYFLAGFLLADLFVSGRLRPSRHLLIWDVAALASGAAIVLLQISVAQRQLLPGPAAVADRIALCLLPFACVLAYCGVFKGVLLRRALTLTWVTTIGGMCYTIYLLHDVVLQNLLPMVVPAIATGSVALNLVVVTAITAAAVLAVSVGYFVLIERPSMDPRWPSRLRARVRHGVHRWGRRLARLRTSVSAW